MIHKLKFPIWKVDLNFIKIINFVQIKCNLFVFNLEEVFFPF